MSINELWNEFVEESKEFEKIVFTLQSPEPHTYNPKKKKMQLKKLKILKKSLKKLKYGILRNKELRKE